MKKLTHVDFSLENCELYKIPVEHIEFLNFKKIERTIIYGYDSFSDALSCKNIVVKIKPSGNMAEFNVTAYDENELPFTRFDKYADIVSIGLYYDDDTQEDYYVPFKEEERDTNKYQSQGFDDHGNMVIVINKKVTALQIINQTASSF